MPLLFLAALAATPAGAFQANDPVIGRWLTETREGIVEIQRCGPSVCGRLISSTALKANPNYPDKNNADPKLRNRPLRNLTILSGFKSAGGGVWSGGSIYNAEDGKTYSAKLTPDGPNQLKVRGCIFFPLCKTQTWRRVR